MLSLPKVWFNNVTNNSLRMNAPPKMATNHGMLWFPQNARRRKESLARAPFKNAATSSTTLSVTTDEHG